MQRSHMIPILVVLAVSGLTGWSMTGSPPPSLRVARADDLAGLAESVARVDAELERRWASAGLTPAETATDLTVLRRLSLALLGTIPSLEELRQFESDQRPDRLLHWSAAMLDDPRFHAYFGERLARSYVGVEQGQFLIFRRDRFTDWLGRQLATRAPYDQVVHDMISGSGVWTAQGEVNFLTAAYANDEFDPNKLAGRTVRAFLGQRIDCAQCHDHPFAEWKQSQFEGLAACYGKVGLSLAGVVDKAEKTHTVEDRETREQRPTTPGVPYATELFETSLQQQAADAPAPTRRMQRRQATGTAPGTAPERARIALADWVVHPDNKRFERAIANRTWALLFGQPYFRSAPVDDLPNPGDPATADATQLLNLLGTEFRSHDCNLRRLILVITSSRAFRMDSVHPSSGDEQLAALEERWALFPLVRLRPEQVIGAMLQSNVVRKIDQDSHLFTRAVRFFRERDFVNEFGDPGEQELLDRPGTIPQALLAMNGEFAAETSDLRPLSTPQEIASFSPTPEKLVENAYLTVLTRLPTAAENRYFVTQLSGEGDRGAIIQDLFWALFNSTEFCWNH